jgi:hypothetical protein
MTNILHKIDLLIVGSWIISLFWANKVFVKKINCWIYYFLISGFSLLWWIGKDLICPDYFTNIVTEIIGILITVFIIDRSYKRISKQEETTYRNCAIRYCRIPLYFLQMQTLIEIFVLWNLQPKLILMDSQRVILINFVVWRNLISGIILQNYRNLLTGITMSYQILIIK